MGYKCFIDESGDEGIDTGGTRWFILGAIIVDEKVEAKTSEVIPRIKTQLGRELKKPLHWTKIRNHDKRLFICSELLKEEWVFSCVVTDKTHPFVKRALGLPEKWKLYFYSTRLLLERISWYARDHGGEKASLVFEKRTNMDYKALKEYLVYLRRWMPPLNIAWEYLNWQNFDIIPKEKYRMLQMADQVCGALSDGLEHTPFGNIEPRYILSLKDRFYRRGSGRNRLFSYGFKFLHVRGDVLAEHGEEYEWLKII
jgi:hypothetical protein